MIARFFIDRPVLANVLSVVLVLLGIVALYKLPVAQYPDVVPPTVQVSARYPGANAQTVIDTIALPIEQQVNGVEKMIYMQSISTSDGSYALIVNKDDVVEQRRIRPGPLVGNLRVIEDGLKPEDRVIVSGNQRAVPSQKVAPQPATITPTP